MTVPEHSAGFDRLRQLLDDPERYLTPVEAHGLICAMAVHPEPPADWSSAVTSEPDGPPAELDQLLRAERERIATRLGAGDGVRIPCRLDPFADDEGRDLTAWCTGFMAGVVNSEDVWPDKEADEAERMLPFVLIAGLDEDPELDRLWNDESLVRQMAASIPVVIDELFLELRGAGEPA